MASWSRKLEVPPPDQALPGRTTPMPVAARHAVLDAPLALPFPDYTESAVFALGCFWGAERGLWLVRGFYSSGVGYTGGSTPNPTYVVV
jgi:peptide-methionine (S)-S-oxide reductase